MNKKSEKTGKVTSSLVVFIISGIVSIFWILSQTVDIYKIKLTGIIFEILWLPAIAAIFILPVISFIFWMKEKFKLNSLYFLSILITMITMLILIIKF